MKREYNYVFLMRHYVLCGKKKRKKKRIHTTRVKAHYPYDKGSIEGNPFLRFTQTHPNTRVKMLSNYEVVEVTQNA